MDTSQPAPRSDQQANRRYLTVWRWHFYFGLLVAPFLTLLAITGLGMLLFANITGKEGERIHVTPQVQVQPLSAQAEAARQSVNPETASVVQYIVNLTLKPRCRSRCGAAVRLCSVRVRGRL